MHRRPSDELRSLGMVLPHREVSDTKYSLQADASALADPVRMLNIIAVSKALLSSLSGNLKNGKQKPCGDVCER